MRFEKEIKIRVDSLDEIEKKLKELGATLVSNCFERNYLFDRENELFRKGEALRLRSFCDKAKLTFKGKRISSTNYKIREEIETPVGNFEAMAKILRKLGFRESFYYEKKRKNYKLEKCLISLDETPLGKFIEIEATEEIIDRVAQLLGFSRRDYITKGYVEMALEKGLKRLCFQCGD